MVVHSETRIERLREIVRKTPEMCTERAILVTESYKETESDPFPIKRARAIEKILKNMSISIEEDEIIVGRATSKRVAGPMFPEAQWKWYFDEIDTLSRRDVEEFKPLGPEEKARIKDALLFWKGKSLFDKFYAVAPEDYQKSKYKLWMPGGGNPDVGIHLAHCCPGFERVIALGLNKIKSTVNSYLGNLDLTIGENFSKLVFYQAVNIIIDAEIEFARRYANLAKQLASVEKNSQRKLELEMIAEACDWIPANPARSFYEALQSLWFTYIAVMLEGWGPGIGFGRMDQYLYPYYKKDIETGRITKEFARELIALFYIKVNELVMPFSEKSTNTRGSGQLTLSVITLGGVNASGTSAVNELSYLFLEAEEMVHLQEDIAIRVSENTPDKFLVQACELAKKLVGKIKFISDETVTKQLLNDGKPIEYARDYAITGCFIHTVPGKSFDPGGDFINLPMMLELALNDGVSRLSGEQLGPRTGNPREFKTFDDVWSAYDIQVQDFFRKCIASTNIYRQLFADLLPMPLQSALYDGCIEKGVDVTAGGTNPYSTMGFWVCGIPNVADSLTVIKKLVFEEKRVTMQRLINALDNNFASDEELYHLINQVPRYGNDDDYADSMVNQVILHLSKLLASFRGFAGLKFTLAAGTVAAYVPLGRAVGALPDGRKSAEPLAEGGISPYQGRNISGPTATMRSVAKLNLVRVSGGAVLNMRFSPESLKDKGKIEKFARLIKEFCAMGGDLVQFNIVSSATLREAQKNPEKYRDLLVRVATYSAYFVDLPLELQNDIIARTEFTEL